MYLPPNVTSSCKMARTKQARIPGCGRGEAVSDLTSLALEHLGLCSSQVRGQGTYAEAPRARASGKKNKTNTPLHGASYLGTGGRPKLQFLEGVCPKDLWEYLEGSLGWGAVCDTSAVWVVVCLSAVLKQGSPVPFSSLPLPPLFPMGQRKSFS